MSLLKDARSRLSKSVALPNPSLGPVLVNMADVEPTEVRWLWPDRIALGRITLLIGMPGEGKSFLTADIASRVSRGALWPDGGQAPHGDVILLSAEDDPNDTIRPRLDACGADVSRISLMKSFTQTGKGGKVEECLFTLNDIDQLQAAVRLKPGCKLVVVDPVGSFIGGKVDIHRDNEVRAVLSPLADLASRLNFAVVAVVHRRKATSSHADDLAMGSRAFTGIARAAWHLTRDTDDKERRLLLSGKNNLAKEPNGLAFRITGTPAKIEWEPNPVEMTANENLVLENAGANLKTNHEGRDRPAIAEAKKFLEDILVKSPLAADEVKSKAKQAGISWTTIERAKEGLAESRKSGFDGGWRWHLIGAEYAETDRKNPDLFESDGLRRSSENPSENTLFHPSKTDKANNVGGLREIPVENKDSEVDLPEDRQDRHYVSEDREAEIAAALPPDARPINRARKSKPK